MSRVRSVLAAVLSIGLAVALGALAGCAHSPIDKARQYGIGLADGGLGVGKFIATLNEQKEAEAEALASTDVAKAKLFRTEWRHVYDILDKAVKTFGAGVTALRAGIEIAAHASCVNGMDVDELCRLHQQACYAVITGRHMGVL